MAAILPVSVAPRPLALRPPMWRPKAATETLRPSRAAVTAAAMPADVPPYTHTSVVTVPDRGGTG